MLPFSLPSSVACNVFQTPLALKLFFIIKYEFFFSFFLWIFKFPTKSF